MKIAIATDHGGFSLKTYVVDFLKTKHIECKDLGPETDESVDYPDYAIKVAQMVSSGEADAGILICGTGIGMAMVANKFKGVRAVAVSDRFSAQMSKEHNNANVLCLGGRITTPQIAHELIEIWLDSKYEGERHAKRLEKMSEVEKRNLK